MAYKLVGDQIGAIRQGQKKRVSELLLNRIPEDEALLTRSGRFACLICGHRPVFDTVAVLSVHRSGRKHIQASTKRLRSQEMEKIKTIKGFECGKDELPPMLEKAKKAKLDFLKGLSSPLANNDPLLTTESNSDIGGSTYPLVPGGKRKHDNTAFVFPWKHEQVKKPKVKQQPDEQQLELNSVSLRSSGWIPNGDGTWRKDPNVEFDSDEEEPESVSESASESAYC